MTITLGLQRRSMAALVLIPLAVAGFAFAALHPIHHEVAWVKRPGITIAATTTLPDN